MKRPFLLVEVLIAVALVALSAYPLITPHYEMIGRKVELLRELQLEHAASEAFAEAQILVYEGVFPWKSLTKVDRGKSTQPLTPVKINVRGREEVYEAKVTITVEKKASRDTRKYFRLFDLAITLTSDKKTQTYHYFLYGEHLGKNG